MDDFETLRVVIPREPAGLLEALDRIEAFVTNCLARVQELEAQYALACKQLAARNARVEELEGLVGECKCGSVNCGSIHPRTEVERLRARVKELEKDNARMAHENRFYHDAIAVQDVLMARVRELEEDLSAVVKWNRKNLDRVRELEAETNDCAETHGKVYARVQELEAQYALACKQLAARNDRVEELEFALEQERGWFEEKLQAEARVQELEAENARLRWSLKNADEDNDALKTEAFGLQGENSRLSKVAAGFVRPTVERELEARVKELEADVEIQARFCNKLRDEAERLREALKTAEKETHICGPRSMYSEDECPGHRIRQALAEPKS